jgi:hypothetical protein
MLECYGAAARTDMVPLIQSLEAVGNLVHAEPHRNRRGGPGWETRVCPDPNSRPRCSNDSPEKPSDGFDRGHHGAF